MTNKNNTELKKQEQILANENLTIMDKSEIMGEMYWNFYKDEITKGLYTPMTLYSIHGSNLPTYWVVSINGYQMYFAPGLEVKVPNSLVKPVKDSFNGLNYDVLTKRESIDTNN